VGGVARRNIPLLCLINFLVMLGFGAFNLLRTYLVLALKGVLTSLPEEVASISAGEAVIELSFMMSSFMATRIIIAALSGWLGDVVGKRKVISIGLLIYIVVGLLYLLVVSVDQLIALRAIQGIASGMVWPVAQALLADSVDRSFRGRAISIYVMSSNVARILGPMIGVLAYSFTVNVLGFRDPISAFRTPTVLISVFSLPALIASFLVIDVGSGRGSLSPGKPRGLKLGSFIDGFRALNREVRRSLLVIFVNGLVNGFAMGLVMSVAMVYAIEYVVKDPATIGGIMSLAAVVGLIMAYPGSWLSDRIGRKWVIVASMIPSRIAIILMPYTRDLTSFTTVFLLRTVSFNVSMPVMRALQADMVSVDLRGRVFGLQQAFSNLGMLIGPLVGSYLYYSLRSKAFAPWLPGVAVPFIIAGVLGLISLILFVLFVTELSVEDSE